MSNHKIYWTKPEDDIIRSGYSQAMTDREIQTLLPNRTVQAVHIRRAMGLGLRRFGLRRFSPEEISYLRDAYPRNIAIEDMAVHLNRSVGTLRQCILRLKLNRDGRKTKLAKRYGMEALAIHEDPAVIKEILANIDAKEAEAAKQLYADKVAAALKVMVDNISSGGDRKIAMRVARLAGATLAQCGDALGLTRERIRQITHDVRPGAKWRIVRAGSMRMPRVINCVRCGDNFTVESAGAFKYCTKCHLVRKEEYKIQNNLNARAYAKAHPDRIKGYALATRKRQQEASRLLKALQANPDTAKLVEEVKGKLNGNEDGSNGLS